VEVPHRLDPSEYYAVDVVVGKERRVSEALRRLGYVEVTSPIAGYVQFSAKAINRDMIQQIPNVRQVMALGHESLSVPSNEQPGTESFKEGDLVRIRCGTYKKFSGILLAWKDQAGVVDTMMFGRSVRVPVGHDEIESIPLPEAWK
jgi:transcription antitermination factor NusG